MKFYPNLARQHYMDFIYPHTCHAQEQRKRKKRNTGFSEVGMVSFREIERLCAVLTGSQKNFSIGTDLRGFEGKIAEDKEVKSALDGRGFSYKFYRGIAEMRLEQNLRAHHLFVSYNEDYSHLAIRHIGPLDKAWPVLVDCFESWRPHIIQNCVIEERACCTRTVPYSMAAVYGDLVLLIEDCVVRKVTYCEPEIPSYYKEEKLSV